MMDFWNSVFMFLCGVGVGWVTMAYMQLAEVIPEDEEGEDLE